MARKERMRYWKISSEDTDTFDYDESKLLNWEIKCIREPEGERGEARRDRRTERERHIHQMSG